MTLMRLGEIQKNVDPSRRDAGRLNYLFGGELEQDRSSREVGVSSGT